MLLETIGRKYLENRNGKKKQEGIIKYSGKEGPAYHHYVFSSHPMYIVQNIGIVRSLRIWTRTD